MSIQLKDGMVLTVDDGGTTLVADDPGCCCGGCPAGLSLICDSISASKSKCGYQNSWWTEPFKYYLTREDVCDYTETFQVTCPEGNEPFDITQHCAATGTFDSDCVSSESGGCTRFTSSPNCDGSGTFFTSTTSDSRALGDHCTFGGSVTTTETTYTKSESFSNDDDSWSRSYTQTLSDEYTTDMLVSNTEAALPSYFGHLGCDEDEELGFRGAGQNCVCFSSSNLSPDESSYSITRSKYQIVWSTPLTHAVTINWVERFTPEGGGAPTDTPKSESVGIGATGTTIHELFEPDTDGSTTVPTDEITCS